MDSYDTNRFLGALESIKDALLKIHDDLLRVGDLLAAAMEEAEDGELVLRVRES